MCNGPCRERGLNTDVPRTEPPPLRRTHLSTRGASRPDKWVVSLDFGRHVLRLILGRSHGFFLRNASSTSLAVPATPQHQNARRDATGFR